LFALAGTVLILYVAQRSEPSLREVFERRSVVVKKVGSGGIGTFRLSRNTLAMFAPMLALGLNLGVGGVAITAWAVNAGSPAMSGVMFAAMSAAGIMGAILYGRFGGTGRRLWEHYAALSVFGGIGSALFAAAQSPALALCGSLVVGAAMTPTFTVAYTLVDKAFSKHHFNQANASLGSLYNIGSGAGALIGGLLIVQAGLGPTFGLSAIFTALAGSAALLGRSGGQEEVPGSQHAVSNNSAQA
jgi:MFS family permease